MNFRIVSLAATLFVFAVFAVNAQDVIVVKPTPARSGGSGLGAAEKLSVMLKRALEARSKPDQISREDREAAYALLLAGQRHKFNFERKRLQASGRLARQNFVDALAKNPHLAEAYTALAEMTLVMPPTDLDEATALLEIAVGIQRDSFGAQRLLARGYTIKSRLMEDMLDTKFADKAVGSWKEVIRIDARNAEAWAFLAEFHKRAGRTDEQIQALRNWLGAAAPTEVRFYRSILGAQANLSPEAASQQLGEVLLNAGRTREAVEILNQTVADDPDNREALELLERALEFSDPATSATAIQSLQQAIFANPDSLPLVMLLAKVQARAGKFDDATAFVARRVEKLAETNKLMAAGLQIGLGDIYRDANQPEKAVAAYRKALAVSGLDKDSVATDDDREVALTIFDSMIGVYRVAGRIDDAKKLIAEAKLFLGDEDSFGDRQLIALYRENGRKQEALQAVRFARVRFPDDYTFLRLEAFALVELGRIDDAATLVRGLIGKKTSGAPVAMFDDFTNYLLLSTLYGEAKRGREAVEAANQATSLARSFEQKQMARLSLASAQQSAGEFEGAEATLRGILAQSPSNPIAQNNLGYFLAERNVKLDEALKLVQGALKVDPNNSSYLDTLGWVYFRLGNLELAEQNLKKSLRFDAGSATVHDHLGDVYQKQGKTDLARASWQKALTLASDPELVNSLKTKLKIKATK